VSDLKVESVILAVVALCIFMSFYFTYLSFQTADDMFKKQFMILAASSLITCVVVFACMTIYIGIKKTIARFRGQLNDSEEHMDSENA
jgi:TRAP-type C4-dicarboxylate transport system permease small subunit